MNINEIRLDSLQFADFLHRLSQDPFREIGGITCGFDHATVSVAGSSYEPNGRKPSLHIVVTEAVYRGLWSLPRADYFRNASKRQQNITDLFSSTHDQHHGRKKEVLRHFGSAEIGSSNTSLLELMDAGLERWQHKGYVYPYAAMQAIATRYFCKFAFGVVPSREESLTLSRASLIDSKVIIRDMTNPRHFPCARSLPARRTPKPLSEYEKGIMNANERWIHELIERRIVKNGPQDMSEEASDILDAFIKRIVLSQGGKLEGTLASQMNALAVC